MSVIVQSPSWVWLFATLWLRHARPPCPSPSSKVWVRSCPFHQWWHPAISSSDTLFSFCPQSFQASGTLPISWLFTSDDQNTGVSASAAVLSMSIQGWFPIRLTGFILLSKGCSGVFSRPQFKSIDFLVLCLFTVKLSQPYVATGKTSLDYRDLCHQSDASASQPII